MMRWNAVGILVLTAVSANGCLNPMETRLPTLVSRSPELERKSAQFVDPFPNERLAPATGVRPPLFLQQRSEPWRLKEQNYILGLKQQFGVPAPPTGQTFSGSVPE